ncbi:hypothetical protein HMPREF1981_01917, partial [Bacteroides pyogenes F0041]
MRQCRWRRGPRKEEAGEAAPAMLQERHRGSCPFTETGFRLREWDVVLAGVECCACRSEAPCDAKRENVPRESGKKAGKAGAKNDRKCENRSEYIFLKIYYYYFFIL